MKVEFPNEDRYDNEHLKEKVEPTNDLKDFIIDYVGNKLQSEDGEVTVDMILEVISVDFPEIISSIAEMNFLQGYKQALMDYETYYEQVRTNIPPKQKVSDSE